MFKDAPGARWGSVRQRTQGLPVSGFDGQWPTEETLASRSPMLGPPGFVS